MAEAEGGGVVEGRDFGHGGLPMRAQDLSYCTAEERARRRQEERPKESPDEPH